MQTFGDFLGFNPHCHILVTDGCFYGTRGMFRSCRSLLWRSAILLGRLHRSITYQKRGVPEKSIRKALRNAYLTGNSSGNRTDG
ncbi:MAG: transposase [Pseudomonadota bacterium]|nr:transposase [Pseudomonadota bacterium]